MAKKTNTKTNKKNLSLFCLNICTAFLRTTHKWLPSSLATAGSELQANIISSNNMNHEELNSDQEVLEQYQDEMAEAAESPPLSVTQLLLRRGLAALVMVFILGAGILINKIVVKLLK